MLFNLWFDMPHRPTKDVDMLGYGDHGLDALAEIFKEVCGIFVDDGIVFNAETVNAIEIRKDSNYEGVRVTFTGLIDNVRCPIQIDIGYGDAVTPQADHVEYPVLLPDMPKPTLCAYPRYTVVAEKTEALIKLAMANTRLKDYFDLWVVSKHLDFDGPLLQQAIAATLERRKTEIDRDPVGLSDDFANDRGKRTQWNAFIRKNKLTAPVLDVVIEQLKQFLIPVLASQAGSQTLDRQWPAGGPWRRHE